MKQFIALSALEKCFENRCHSRDATFDRFQYKFSFLFANISFSFNWKKKGLKVPQNMTFFVWMNNDLHKTIQNSSRFKDSK